MNGLSLEQRLAFIQCELAGLGDTAVLDYPISTWVRSTDRHLPQAFLSRPLRDVLTLTYQRLSRTPGVGDRRIEKLIDVLERVTKQKPTDHASLSGQTDRYLEGAGPVSTAQVAPQDLTEPVWREWCQAIHAHRLEHESLGRFAVSLRDLPQGLWSVSLSEYLGRSLVDIRTMTGHGPARVGQVLDVFSRIAQTIADCPVDRPLAVRLLPPLVRDAMLWAEKVLHAQAVPSTQEIREGFLQPLFAILEGDMGVETSAIVGRRIGLDGPKETLDQIGNDVGLTRERIRQLALRAVAILQIRWPEGRYILDNIYAHLLASPGCDEQLELMHSVLDSCFALEITRGSSRAEVLAAWDRVGRARRTPMTGPELRSWSLKEFPDQPADVTRRWLEEEGLRHTGTGQEPLFFSNDPLDVLLLHLYTHPEPISVGELADFIEGEERNLRGRVERDPRLIEDEFKRVVPAERCSFFRREGQWNIRLEPIATAGIESRAETIAVAELVHLIVGGLIEVGVCDATVWGVHRFAVSLLRKVYGAAFAPAVTPFILASTLVRHSNGMVRHMRRRRLRWDSADGSIPIRGKRGWIDYVTTMAGVPMTFDELDAALRVRFQDYESYALKQSSQNDDEEGEASLGYQFVAGVSHVIPTVIIPRDWELDLGAGNVSEGVQLAVARIVAMSTRSPFPKWYLRRVPWMVRLCDHAAYGAMRWEERPVSIEEDSSTDDAAAEPVAPSDRGSDSRLKSEGSAAVDDLLSQLF